MSKCFGLIDRFSEDIDITFINEGAELTQGQRRKVNHNVLAVCEELGFKVLNQSEIRSRRLFNQYHIDTGYMTGSDNVRETIIVEIALQTIPYPIVIRPLNNYVTQYLIENSIIDVIEAYEMDRFMLNVQSLDRTLIDKVFAICDYHMVKNYKETSRHIYDLYKLWPIVRSDLTKAMIEDVRIVRSKLPVCPSAANDVSINELLQEIVDGEEYKSDYNNSTRRLLFEELEYEKAIGILSQIIDFNEFD